MHRFYLPSPSLQGEIVNITETHLVHQLERVLRLRPGNEFCLFDDQGEEYKVKILELDRRRILAQRVERIERTTESPITISLYQAIPKKTVLFEWVIEKATELGVSEIFPLITERTEKRRLSKFERLQRIAIESTEQCGRTRIPLIHHPIALEAALAKSTNGYLAYEYEEGKDLPDYGKLLSAGGAVQLFIGPEGGFGQKEVALAEKAGLRLFSLGPRILRTETAAIASLALLLHSLR